MLTMSFKASYLVKHMLELILGIPRAYTLVKRYRPPWPCRATHYKAIARIQAACDARDEGPWDICIMAPRCLTTPAEWGLPKLAASH